MEIQKTMSTRSTTKGNGASKTAFYKTKTGKCQRPSGTLHRNPYLNFLREFRLRNTDLSAVEIICRGAREWKSMPKEEKLQYIEEKRKPPAPPPIPAQPTQMRAMPFQESCGIVCPNPCAKKRRRRKSKCARRRRPKRRRCAKKRRPKRRGCKRKKRRTCRI
nr:protamine isoform X2 [Bactrocera oleae]